MGIHDRSLLCVVQSKVRSYIADLPWVSSSRPLMSGTGGDFSVCCDCHTYLTMSGYRYCCRSCKRLFCGNCIYYPDGVVSDYFVQDGVCRPMLCKFCFQVVSLGDELPGGGFGEKFESVASSCKMVVHPEMEQFSPIYLSCSTARSCGEEEKDCSKCSLSPSSSIFSQDITELESSSFSTGSELYSFKSSPSSPNRADQQSEGCRVSPKHGFPEDVDCLRTLRPEKEDAMEISGDCHVKMPVFPHPQSQILQKPFDLENNSLVWLPPPAKNGSNNKKSDMLEDEDEDDDVGLTSTAFKSCSFDLDAFSAKQNPSHTWFELQKASVYKDFKALVFHFLKVEGICIMSENRGNGWLEIVSSLAWQAANYVKPNTVKGDSMDPADYVKVKCMLTGNPQESVLVKGVVCTRNIKHKRMITQHANPKILILGGSLEYEKVFDKFASINTVLEKETDHLKLVFSKIEAHKPNVVLVEKSVSPHVVDYMLEKGISLVSNVKRLLLERISRCTGASITDSLDGIPSARVGYCEVFHIRRFPAGYTGSQPSRKFSKTMMFLEGCPRRLGCTVLLKGARLEELKKVKRAVQYAIFAAYHLSLETSFLADEGARLPEVLSNTSPIVEKMLTTADGCFPALFGVSCAELHPSIMNLPQKSGSSSPCTCHSSPRMNFHHDTTESEEVEIELFSHHAYSDQNFPDAINGLHAHGHHDIKSRDRSKDLDESSDFPDDVKESETKVRTDLTGGNMISGEHSSGTESSQSILVSFTKSCVKTGTICKRPHLFRIKFYGNFDKPLGKYLSDYIFDEMSCQFCKEPSYAHVISYTHQRGNLTISIKRLQSTVLPGEHDDHIWMWHRCLKCAEEDGVPPAAQRVVMSDAAKKLSFGKFLELSFSNHATANRVASCGHSLQKECLRFYGMGNTVACFRYSPSDILLVHLPPSKLEFTCLLQQQWLKREETEVFCKINALFIELFDLLHTIEEKIPGSEYETVQESILVDISSLKERLRKAKHAYNALVLHAKLENMQISQRNSNILKLNGIRRLLLIDSYEWDHKIHLLDLSLQNKKSASRGEFRVPTSVNLVRCDEFHQIGELDCSLGKHDIKEAESNLLYKIDLSWTSGQQSTEVKRWTKLQVGTDDPYSRKHTLPARVNSFDSALRSRNINRLTPNIRRVYSQNSSSQTNFTFCHTSLVSSTSLLVNDGARLLLPEPFCDDSFVAVYDNEPSSVIAYALFSEEHADFVASAPRPQSGSREGEMGKNKQFSDQTTSALLVPQANEKYELHGPDDKSFQGTSPSERKQHHFRFSFNDEFSFPGDRMKFSVHCYFAKLFHDLRKKCCPNEMDFISSLSRCKKWSAQGGKSNAYFAKSLDERFILKQVSKTELDAFGEFAQQYFDYLSESINTGSPTCLAKILGIYQVTVKNLKGGREEKMDLMVMENLFFGRNPSKVYDLKGSLRARYADTTGSNKVMLDQNLMEALQINPIFLGSKGKRRLERAIWNDTAFLASIDVMDYSLLVGVDNERKELVIGIIDFMRQYTWDKQLETWVKASGFLGGPKNASPTVVSPDVYKKRFRKAMSSYFLTVPDQ